MFSVLFDDRWSAEQVTAFVDALQLFKIGMSWGGLISLALVYPQLDRPGKDHAGRPVRLNVGFEEVSDLKDDLAQALHTMGSSL